ncbi:hypothetical protein A1Q1_07817 [Trichosporon asahii var. asahii CBS 2479]|uniref:Uncharacterized protein n=1 Tax=Trichosporon asahii var. asahii (strain ATCC 90039 / CBS 2479 / JCM 2466 / KCTC 7840 / NBRC 103889/ NCYC 2677 / UAMH 7654) TaxID=1186058 RepID=J5R721_TRIAS|nr:hypothetical protein A1Q1_07817 [Trichosporon asahii var. asahii CBS 2479]EJT51023.1 hypothetical protein A1Q1_07817 [Trichosporon asahii var. asahii CBS 2479]
MDPDPTPQWWTGWLRESMHMCPLESDFQTVNSSYNWTQAYDKYNPNQFDVEQHDRLEKLFMVNSDPGYNWGTMPGCFYLGTLNRTKVDTCQSYGGMAIMNSRTRDIVDADVWYCGLRAQDYDPRKDTDAINTRISELRSGMSDLAITCQVPGSSAARRIPWSWTPVLSVGVTSLVALL